MATKSNRMDANAGSYDPGGQKQGNPESRPTPQSPGTENPRPRHDKPDAEGPRNPQDVPGQKFGERSSGPNVQDQKQNEQQPARNRQDLGSRDKESHQDQGGKPKEQNHPGEGKERHGESDQRESQHQGSQH